MRKPSHLRRWDAALEAYLSSRRALGRRYAGEERVLRSVRSYLSRRGLGDLDEASFRAWRRRLGHCAPNTQRDYATIVYRFCRYRRRVEPGCYLPDRVSLGRRHAYPLPAPVDADQIARLLAFLAGLPFLRQRPLRQTAVHLAIILMFTAGLRRGEVAHLTLADVDPDEGVLRIRESKLHKSRWVPLSRSATRELQIYLAARRQIEPHPRPDAPLLCSRPSCYYGSNTLSTAVKRVMVQSGIWSGASRLARVHDLRHGFAVAALKRWYEQDVDVQSNLPKPALYMGHVSIASTAYYPRFMPAVVALASQRFGRAFGDLVDGGAP